MSCCLVVCLLVAGCSSDKSEKSSIPKSDSAESQSNGSDTGKPKEVVEDLPPVNNPAFHKGITEAVGGYLRFPMVNDIAQEAPADCRAASDSNAQPRMSNSDDDSTHGRKLYYLFAKDITHYLMPEGKDAPVGQTLVKESWTSEPSNPQARNMRNHSSGLRINPRATVNGKVFEIGQRTNLFVMTKLDPKTADTDQGWVYGVMDPNTKEISESGRVRSCMKCHESAKHDRLFGPKLDE